MRLLAEAEMKWIPASGTFQWPEGIEIKFPDGSVYDRTGARDINGLSMDYNPDGRGACGSPCHQVLVAAGLIG